VVDPIPLRRPIRWSDLRSDEAERVIRAWAQDTSRILISDHAFDRLGERFDEEPLDTPTVYRILKVGRVQGDPIRNERGHWQATMVLRMPGGRDAGAVTVILREDRKLIVRTVMWEDSQR
jgi:hypothetical protein